MGSEDRMVEFYIRLNLIILLIFGVKIPGEYKQFHMAWVSLESVVSEGMGLREGCCPIGLLSCGWSRGGLMNSGLNMVTDGRVVDSWQVEISK